MLTLSLQFDSVSELCDLVINRAAFCHQVANLAISVHDGGVVAAAEGLTDFR